MTKNDYAIKETIKKNIRSFREQNKFTQAQLSVIMGTDRTTYTKWETGDSIPNPVQLAMLATIFGKSVDDFYKANSEFSVANPMLDHLGDSNYTKELDADEKILIAEYRLLNKCEREQINNLIQELKNTTKELSH